MGRAPRSSPTAGLLVGLVITLAAVLTSGWYVTRQISGLRALQSDITDRNRRDSLQLLRIQNDLDSLAVAMRDMLDNDEGYPLSAWAAQFDRIRTDLDDALRTQAGVSAVPRTPEQRDYLAAQVAQFWDAVDRIFALAREGRDAEARDQIRNSLQARQAALATAVARLLVENHEAEEETARRVQAIYADVQRQVSWTAAAVVATILLTSLYLIRSNRRLFAELASLSEARRDLAQRLITTRESTLGEIARELHDDLGQVLTALGSMVGRLRRRAPPDAAIAADLDEIAGVAQTAIDNVRGLSQALHPSLLEDAGLEGTIEWHLSALQRQTGLTVSYERRGEPRAVGGAVAIHVYRILQEALNNVARHSGASQAAVRLSFAPAALILEVEDHGRGIAHPPDPPPAASLGIVTMRERAALLGGTITFDHPPEGGTRVRLTVPHSTVN